MWTTSEEMPYNESPLLIDSMGFPGSSDSKESACNAGDPGSIPGLGRPPGEGNSYPLQYSCMEKSMERGDWWATVHRVTKIQIQLSNSHSHFTFHFHRLKPVPHQRTQCLLHQMLERDLTQASCELPTA